MCSIRMNLFMNSNDIDRKNREFHESMRGAMEDLIGRALGVSDYKFTVLCRH